MAEEDSSSYQLIDPVIAGWAQSHGLVAFTEWAGEPARWFHTSSSKGECFQISIKPPIGSVVTIDIWSVETVDDEEIHHAWTVPVSELARALEKAFARTEALKARNGRR